MTVKPSSEGRIGAGEHMARYMLMIAQLCVRYSGLNNLAVAVLNEIEQFHSAAPGRNDVEMKTWTTEDSEHIRKKSASVWECC